MTEKSTSEVKRSLFADHPRTLGSKIRNEGYRGGCHTCGWTGDLVDDEEDAFEDAVDHGFQNPGETHVTYVEECNRLAGSDREPAWAVDTDTDRSGGDRR